MAYLLRFKNPFKLNKIKYNQIINLKKNRLN